MTPRKVYEDKLKKLNKNIMEMGQRTEEFIDKTIQAIINNDNDLARSIIEQDDVIDAMQLEIEKECALLIAHQQPVAGDLRFVISVVKIVTDLERIADQCCDICKYNIRLNDGTWSREINYKRHIEKMAFGAKAMLQEVLNAFISKDIEVVKETYKEDDKIDSIFIKIWEEITEEMIANKDFIQNGVHYIMIIKYLERIGDHITNIAEWIIYSSTGEYAIHKPIE
ncbi:phosphate signaling complex protein PhoU [Cellulosilyticum sp. I15G10I2]|uniref:phosphate signaling complex protein PhoU n=1 Tax=Cellulosilyticum sp. I15G10I2 TaxID=1892843 RepID=UPI00085BB911|nr:phosphate signaling complex protein PhoU [Cellulosilyticum sp. I15G10I2]